MSDARAEILARLRGKGAGDADAVAARLARHPRNLVPARAASLDHAGQVALFARLAAEADASVAHVAALADVPEAVARYLAERNLAPGAVLTPDARLDRAPWERALLELRRGRVEAADAVGIGMAFAGIAETGTLVLHSGADHATRNNFLPETHIVVLAAGDVVGSYEEAWDRLRALGAMPRAVNLITGPSRTADIAQRLELGIHGPRRLHIVLVADGDAPAER
ncbi:MAG TPA: lactate utilization protein [Stellaceae bacterium]|nr:lactate utilization protein [Stellaceae bacterium]